MVDEHVLGNDVHHGHAGIQTGVGVLEDDLHIPALVAHLTDGVLGDVLPLKVDLPVGGLNEL